MRRVIEAMHSRKGRIMKSRFLVLGLALLPLGLSACVVVPVHETRHNAPAVVPMVVVRAAPPPLIREHRGPPPAAGFVWIDGYWNHAGVRYVWVPGRWSAPRHGYQWKPRRWERRDDRWHPRDGRWEKRYDGRW
jgi:hypothetical protein